MNRLLEIGFQQAGSWAWRKDRLDFDLILFEQQKKVLYSFVADGEVCYIGKTMRTLRKRMAEYRDPGSTQVTNLRVNSFIVEAIQKDVSVEILVLPDNGLMHYGKFHLNLAAGLEDSMIRDIAPRWNGPKRSRAKDESRDDVDLPPIVGAFQIRLQPTYLRTGFFNVPVANSESIGQDQETMEIYMENTLKPVMGLINRRSNSNGSPRIFGGTELRKWFHENCVENCQVTVEVLSPRAIRLLPEN